MSSIRWWFICTKLHTGLIFWSSYKQMSMRAQLTISWSSLILEVCSDSSFLHASRSSMLSAFCVSLFLMLMLPTLLRFDPPTQIIILIIHPYNETWYCKKMCSQRAQVRDSYLLGLATLPLGLAAAQQGSLKFP